LIFSRKVKQPAELVPGDVVMLEAGNIVPADLRLVEAAQLRTDEAALTGESMPVDKSIASVHDEHVSLGDKRNIAYKGTIITYGRGAGVVVETGMQTELGKVAALLQEGEEVKNPSPETPGQVWPIDCHSCSCYMRYGICDGYP